jgi:hypothetical protein
LNFVVTAGIILCYPADSGDAKSLDSEYSLLPTSAQTSLRSFVVNVYDVLA